MARTRSPAADGPVVAGGRAPPAEAPPLTVTEAKAAAVVNAAVDLLPPSGWVRRWWIIRLTLIMFAGIDIAIVAQVLRLGITADAPILIHIFISSTTAIMGIVGSYVFGAVFDDNATKAAVTEITTTMGKK